MIKIENVSAKWSITRTYNGTLTILSCQDVSESSVTVCLFRTHSIQRKHFTYASVCHINRMIIDKFCSATLYKIYEIILNAENIFLYQKKKRKPLSK